MLYTRGNPVRSEVAQVPLKEGSYDEFEAACGPQAKRNTVKWIRDPL
jgi:hypothetical protein